MSSSTSSFKTEWKVLAVVTLTVLTLEVTARWAETTLGQVVARYQNYPRLSQSFAALDAPGILLLGNSMTEHGIKLDTLSSELTHSGVRAPVLCKVAPLDTGVVEWQYVYRSCFGAGEAHPDIVVLGFAGQVLCDGRRPDTLRLGRYFCSLEQTGDLFDHDLPNFGDRAEFLFAKGFALVGCRQKIRHALLSRILPEYERQLRALNARVRTHPSAGCDPSRETKSTYSCLVRFLTFLQEQNIQAVVVAMPLPYDWPVEEELRKTLCDHRAILLDCRTLEGLHAEDFPDGFHLSPRGAVLYTQQLARNLAPLVPVREKTARRRHLTARTPPQKGE